MEVYARFLKNSVVFTDKGEFKKKAQFNLKCGGTMDDLMQNHAAISKKKYDMKKIHPSLRSQYSKLMRTFDLVNTELSFVSASSLKQVVLKTKEAGTRCDSQSTAPVIFKALNDINDEIDELKNKNKKFISDNKAAKKAAAEAAAAKAAAQEPESWEDLVDEPAVDTELHAVDSETEFDSDTEDETEVDTESDPESITENNNKTEEKELDRKYIRCSDGFIMLRGHTRWSDSDPEYDDYDENAETEKLVTCSDGFVMMRGHTRWSDSDCDEE
jgi:hypothetical protein